MPKKRFDFGSVVAEITQQTHPTDETHNGSIAFDDEVSKNALPVNGQHNMNNGYVAHDTAQTQFMEKAPINQDDKVIANNTNEQYDTSEHITNAAENAKKEYGVQHTQDEHNTHIGSTDNRRFSLILPEKLFEDVKVMASLKQSSVTKVILVALEKYTNENNEIIERYKNIFKDLH